MWAFMPSRTCRTAGRSGWAAAVPNATAHGSGTGSPRRPESRASRYNRANATSQRSTHSGSAKAPARSAPATARVVRR